MFNIWAAKPENGYAIIVEGQDPDCQVEDIVLFGCDEISVERIDGRGKAFTRRIEEIRREFDASRGNFQPRIIIVPHYAESNPAWLQFERRSAISTRI